MLNQNERDKREVTVDKDLVTWDDIETFITCLDNQFELSTKKKFTSVYGPPRGGVIFAVIISNRYGLPYLGAPQPGCLIVDDIIDSGKTAEAWKGKGYTIATMFYKLGATVRPDYFRSYKQDRWIEFPWEHKNDELVELQETGWNGDY